MKLIATACDNFTGFGLVKEFINHEFALSNLT